MTHHTMSKRSYHGATFGDKDWDVGRNEKIGTLPDWKEIR